MFLICILTRLFGRRETEQFQTMDVKQLCVFVIALCLITVHQTGSVDISERRAAQAMRLMKHLRGYLNMGRDAELNDVVQYAVQKLKADSILRRKKLMMKQMTKIT